MRFKAPVPLSEILKIIDANIESDKGYEVAGLNEIHKVEPGDLTFVDFHKYYEKSINSAATFILINTKMQAPEGKVLIYSDDPFRDYNKLTRHYKPFVSSNSQISPTATIGKNSILQPGVVIGHHVSIGENCIIHPNVTIYDHSVIGNNVIIHANTVLGADAFYFKKRADRKAIYDKLYSCGKVVVEDDVEIGASCTIDKGVSGDTIIGAGTKLDNQVHIGHGTIIGKNCLIAAQVGVAGKVIIEDNVTLWGQVGVSKDLRIGKGAVVYAQSGVPKSLEGNKIYFGSPVSEAKGKMREVAILKMLPELWEKLRK